MLDHVLQPLPDHVRRRFLAQYMSYLRGRDGSIDLAGRSLARRIAFLDGLAERPVRWQGPSPVDARAFARNLHRRAPERGLSEATLWALCAAKANSAKSAAVALTYGQPGYDDPARPAAFIAVEESLHPRFLLAALDVLGIEAEVPAPSKATLEQLGAVSKLPDPVSSPLVLGGELTGALALRLLLMKARALFSAQPAALARIEALVGQVLVDEVGHVHFRRSTLGPKRLLALRLLRPVFVSNFMKDIPEFAALFGEGVVRAELGRDDFSAAMAGLSLPDVTVDQALSLS